LTGMLQHQEREFAILLDLCLERLAAGEPLEEILSAYPAHAEALRQALVSAAWLKNQQETLNPPPGFIVVSWKRIAARLVRPLPKPVPQRPRFEWRFLFAWMVNHRLALQALSVLLILAILLGSLSGTAYAAQSTLPGDRLYPLKLALEETRLAFNFGLVADADLHLFFSDVRVAEMEELTLLQRADFLEQPANRYMNHVNSALTLLTLAGQSSSPRVLNQASELAHAIPELLAVQIDQLEALSAQLNSTNQQLVSQMVMFNTDRVVDAELIAAQIDLRYPRAVVTVPAEKPGSAPSAASQTPGGDAAEKNPAASQTPTQLFINLLTPGTTPYVFGTATSSVSFSASATPTLLAGNTQPTPTSTLKALATAVPTLTPVYTQPPTATLLPEPSETPEPTRVERPSITPRPTNTHRPTPIPLPTKKN
jgi:hypothetical protein